jgi:hypothetical protein
MWQTVEPMTLQDARDGLVGNHDLVIALNTGESAMLPDDSAGADKGFSQ